MDIFMLEELMKYLSYEKIYVFGDSVAKGVVYNMEKRRYELSDKNFISLITEDENVEVRNFSKFGATIAHGLDIFKKRVTNLTAPGVALLEFGGNDCDFLWAEIAENPDREHNPNTPIEVFHKYYGELIEKFREKNILPIIFSLPPLDPDRFFETVSKGLNKDNILKWLGGNTRRIYQWQEFYNAELVSIANDSKVLFYDLRKGFLDKVNPEHYLCIDGMHPNEEGHRLIAENLRSILEKYKIINRKSSLV